MSLLARWVGRAGGPPVDAARWVVLDVESTGLDMWHDELLAIAAVALRVDGERGPCIALSDSFEATLHHAAPTVDKDNILLHGIGVAAQRSGMPPHDALVAFEQWVGRSPLIAFHAAFDEAMIGRAMHKHLKHRLPNPWLDLAPVAGALYPEVGARTLDEWLVCFSIDCAQRHQAAADTLATAELLLRLWPEARRKQCTTFKGLTDLARHRRWLGGG